LPAERDNRDHKVFALVLALGAAGVITAGTAVTTAIASVHPGSSGSRELALAGLHFTYPAVNGAGFVLLVIATLGAVAVAVGGRACWRQRRQYRRLIAQMRLVKRLERDPRVKVRRQQRRR
jgi:hypothetical protein